PNVAIGTAPWYQRKWKGRARISTAGAISGKRAIAARAHRGATIKSSIGANRTGDSPAYGARMKRADVATIAAAAHATGRQSRLWRRHAADSAVATFAGSPSTPNPTRSFVAAYSRSQAVSPADSAGPKTASAAATTATPATPASRVTHACFVQNV